MLQRCQKYILGVNYQRFICYNCSLELFRPITILKDIFKQSNNLYFLGQIDGQQKVQKNCSNVWSSPQRIPDWSGGTRNRWNNRKILWSDLEIRWNNCKIRSKLEPQYWKFSPAVERWPWRWRDPPIVGSPPSCPGSRSGRSSSARSAIPREGSGSETSWSEFDSDFAFRSKCRFRTGFRSKCRFRTGSRSGSATDGFVRFRLPFLLKTSRHPTIHQEQSFAAKKFQKQILTIWRTQRKSLQNSKKYFYFLTCHF